MHCLPDSDSIAQREEVVKGDGEKMFSGLFVKDKEGFEAVILVRNRA
jgi:hypothetical protein